ncbi:MAG: hypothetical protein Kow0062_27660 [Acidobacteriota bacterium]
MAILVLGGAGPEGRWYGPPDPTSAECRGARTLPWCDPLITGHVLRNAFIDKPYLFVPADLASDEEPVVQRLMSCWARLNGYESCSPCLAALRFAGESDVEIVYVELVYEERVRRDRAAGHGEWTERPPWLGPAVAFRDEPLTWLGAEEKSESPAPCIEEEQGR